ncbi:MAG: hypothetical protein U1E78_04370 [Gammaproteobacteria bacterium]
MILSSMKSNGERVEGWINFYNQMNSSNAHLAESVNERFVSELDVDELFNALLERVEQIKSSENRYLISACLKLINRCTDRIFKRQDRRDEAQIITDITELFAKQIRLVSLPFIGQSESTPDYYCFEGAEAEVYFNVLDRLIKKTLEIQEENDRFKLINIQLSLLEAYSDILYLPDFDKKNQLHHLSQTLNNHLRNDSSIYTLENIESNLSRMTIKMFEWWFDSAQIIDPVLRAKELEDFYDAHAFLLDSEQISESLVDCSLQYAEKRSNELLANKKISEWLMFFNEIFVDFLTGKRLNPEQSSIVLKSNDALKSILSNIMATGKQELIFWPSLMLKFENYILHLTRFLQTSLDARDAQGVFSLGINILDYSGLIWTFGFTDAACGYVQFVDEVIDSLSRDKSNFLTKKISEDLIDHGVQSLRVRIDNFHHAQECDPANLRAEMKKHLLLYDAFVTTGDVSSLDHALDLKSFYEAYILRDFDLLSQAAMQLSSQLESLNGSVLESKNPLKLTQSAFIHQICGVILSRKLAPVVVSQWVEMASSIDQSRWARYCANLDIRPLINKFDQEYKYQTTKKLEQLISQAESDDSAVYQSVVLIYHLYINDFERMTEKGALTFLKLMIKKISELLEQVDENYGVPKQPASNVSFPNIIDLYHNRKLIEKYLDKLSSKIVLMSPLLSEDEDFKKVRSEELYEMLIHFEKYLAPICDSNSPDMVHLYLEKFSALGLFDNEKYKNIIETRNPGVNQKEIPRAQQFNVIEMADYFVEVYSRKIQRPDGELHVDLFDEASVLSNLLSELNRLSFQKDTSKRYIDLFEITISLMNKSAQSSAIMYQSNVDMLKIIKQWRLIFNSNNNGIDRLHTLLIIANTVLNKMASDWIRHTAQIQKVREAESKHQAVKIEVTTPLAVDTVKNTKSDQKKLNRKIKKQEARKAKVETKKLAQEAALERAKIEAVKKEEARLKCEREKAEAEKAEIEKARLQAEEKQRRRELAKEQMRAAEERKVAEKAEKLRLQSEKKQRKRLEKQNRNQNQEQSPIIEDRVLETIQVQFENLVIENVDIYQLDHQYETGRKIPMPSDLSSVMKFLSDRGYRTYCVGGFPRDVLLRRGEISKDYDVVTEAPKDIIEEALNSSVLLEGRNLNVKPCLREVLAIPGLYKYKTYDFLVKEKGFDLRRDAENRDFTLNAFYVSWTGEILAPLSNTIPDCDLRTPIKAIGDPLILFKKDPVRILRVIDLSTKMGREIGEAEIRAIKRNAYRLGDLPYEVTIVHLSKLFSLGRSSQNFSKLFNLSLLYPMIKLLENDIHSYISNTEYVKYFVSERSN